MNQISKSMTLESIATIIELDKKFTIDYLLSPTNFSILSEDGSLLKNDPYGLSCLIDNIYIEQEEENAQNIENEILENNNEDEYEDEEVLYSLPINQVDFLNSKGYEVLCENPLEISLLKNSQSFATMFFANLIYQNLLTEN